MKLMKEICLTIVFTRVSGIFLEQPQNKTVEESDTAIFRCLLSNNSFRAVWLINGSDAEFESFQREGISVVSINATSTELYIPGQRRYNNTQVHCAALLYQNYELIYHELSTIALLTVLEIKVWLLSTISQLLSTTPHHVHHGIVTKATPVGVSDVTTIMPLSNPTTESTQRLFLLSLSTGGGVLIFILIMIFFIILFIATKKHRRIKPHEMHEPVYATIPERKADDVLMQDNEAYVSTQRVKRKIVSSEATVECYENPAYATTGK